MSTAKWDWTYVPDCRSANGTKTVRALLNEGWEPFAYALHGPYDALHLRKDLRETT